MADATQEILALAKTRKQLHQSGLEMYSLCGERFRYRYVEGIRRPPSSYVVCGSAVDRGVNADLNNKIVTQELLPLDAVQDIARDYVANKSEGIEPDEDEKGLSIEELIGKTTDKAVRLVKAHHEVAAPKLNPFRVARRFSISLDKFFRQRATELHSKEDDLDDRWEKRTTRRMAESLNAAARDGWDLVGEQDLVEGTGDDKLDVSLPFAIRDLKTSKKSPQENAAKESEQLSVYSLASLVIDGALPSLVALDYLVDLKRGVEYKPIFSAREQKDLLPTLNRIAAAVSGIQQGVFVPIVQGAWQCDPRYCGYFHQCRYVKHPKSVTITSLSGVADNTKPELVQIKTL